jgi:transcriptional antiterminator Rof (Rho-off)
MDRYAVELTTRSGRTIVGSAVDLVVRAPEEFLVVGHDDGTTEEIRVDHIRHIAVLSRPRRFNEHSFAIPGGA